MTRAGVPSEADFSATDAFCDLTTRIPAAKELRLRQESAPRGVDPSHDTAREEMPGALPPPAEWPTRDRMRTTCYFCGRRCLCYRRLHVWACKSIHCPPKTPPAALQPSEGAVTAKTSTASTTEVTVARSKQALGAAQVSAVVLLLLGIGCGEEPEGTERTVVMLLGVAVWGVILSRIARGLIRRIALRSERRP